MIAEHKPDLMTPAQKLQFHLQFMGVMGMAGREEERDKHYLKAQEIAQEMIDAGHSRHRSATLSPPPCGLFYG